MTAFAEEAKETPQDDFEYTVLEDGTAVITMYNGKAEDVEIPAQVDGHIVTGIANYAFPRFTGIKSITLPELAASIGIMLFSVAMI